MPENNFPTGSEALALVHQHLPQVLAADGRQPADWQQARLLNCIARQQLQHHYGGGPARREARTVLGVLEQLDARLQAPAPVVGTWAYAKAQLRRVMPLVERLLAA